MNFNYKALYEKEIEYIKQLPSKPRLLLHACCAPCSSAVLERLQSYFDITIYFYNPNIYPETEYEFRYQELRRLIKEMNLQNIEIIVTDYNNDEFDSIVNGYEGLPEGGARCIKCYNLRLEHSVKYAKENDFDYITTTLTISPHKNAQALNQIGGELAERYGVKYLFSDFKKNEGYKRSCELSKEFDLYRQNYCGCIYSKKFAESKQHPV